MTSYMLAEGFAPTPAADASTGVSISNRFKMQECNRLPFFLLLRNISRIMSKIYFEIINLTLIVSLV